MTDLTLKIRVWTSNNTAPQSQLLEAVEIALKAMTDKATEMHSPTMWSAEILEAKKT